MTPTERVLAELRELGEVKPRGKGWRCLCPAHSDTNPSLDVDEGRDHRVLLCCRSKGCSAASIAQSLGLSMRDLFNGTMPDKLSFDERILATYDYKDERGNLLFQTVRLWDVEKGKDFRQRRPNGKGGWVWKLEDTRRVLYRLSELIVANPLDPVFVVEGEKDVDNLIRLGLAATTNPMGAGKWRKEFAEFLRDRAVIILPDNDELGRAHAVAVAESLRGVAASVRTIELPGLPPKGDVSDWLAAGGSIGRLKEMMEAATDPSPDGKHVGDGGDSPPARKGHSPLPHEDYADITPALNTADFVEGLLIDGAMSVIYGESGCGKTFFALDLSLHVAGGLPWRGREVDQRGVLYLALEGSHGIRNRVAAFKLANKATLADLPFTVVPVSLNLLDPAADTVKVIEAAKAAADRLAVPVGLIVVDTLSRAMAGGNENSPEDMGSLVRNLDTIRQALPAHVSTIHHSGKDGARGARGHSLLRAATDTEIEVSRDPDGTSVARVTKQRELDAEGEFAFRLVSVELGRDRRGKPVTSCVVREADAPVREARLSKDEQAALRTLVGLIAESGSHGSPGVPAGVASVTEAIWRDAFYRTCKPGATADARKKAFRRSVDGLIAAERVSACDEWVWVGTRDKPGQNGTCPGLARDKTGQGY